jgi:hypothetical protein
MTQAGIPAKKRGTRPSRSNTPSISEGLARAGRLTPLTIILSFVLLTEVVVMAGVIGTSAITQLILTIFCVIFPPLIAIPFFLILYHRPIVFYAPHDFGEKMNPGDFLEAISRSSLPRINNLLTDYIARIDERVERIMNNSTTLARLAPTRDMETTIHQLGREIKEQMRVTYLISFDLSDYKLGTMNIPAHPALTVGDILDTLYFRIAEEFPLEPFTYGEGGSSKTRAANEWKIWGPFGHDVMDGIETSARFQKWGSSRALCIESKRLLKVGRLAVR